MSQMIEDCFKIEGLSGKRVLRGEISVNGAKNDVVQALVATLLFDGGVTFSNVPNIEDKIKMLEILSKLGANIENCEDKLFVDATNINSSEIPEDIARMMRASVILIGPVLARMGKISFPHPGGCVLGERPIDFFLEGLKKMGAEVRENNHSYVIEAKNGLKGAEIFFKDPSVTATETFLMTAVLASGKTVLKNCPTEPEIVNLAEFLKSSGANISGIGTSTLTIEGSGKLLKSKDEYRILPDRIEAGSFVILGALAGDIKVTNCIPEHLDSLIYFLRKSGVLIEIGDDFVWVKGVSSQLKSISIKTHEYPGFPTDLQAPMSIFMTQVSGVSKIFETIYESRLTYLETLDLMGANTDVLNPHQAIIEGPTPLRGREVKSPDLRAGLAYILAGIVASGKTIVHDIHHIDRGYESIEKRFQKLGVNIERVKAEIII